MRQRIVCSLLLVSHNERDLRRLCKRGIYIDGGTVAADGPIEEILEIYDADSDQEQ